MSKSPTTIKVFKIIDLLSRHLEGLTLSEISNQLHLAVSTVYDIVQELYREKILVIKNGRLKNYVIGPKLYMYGSAYTKSSNLINVSEKYIRDIADEYCMTAFINKVNGESVIPVYKFESSKAKVKTKSVGEPSKLYNSAAGKIFLTFDEKSHMLLENMELSSDAMNTITDKTLLEQQLDQIKQSNIAYSLREDENHIISIACGVFDRNDNHLAGVLSLIGLYSKNQDLTPIANKLWKSAKEISGILLATEGM